MKGRKNTRFHTCCGKRKRLVDWIWRHKCSDARDMAGMDWTKVKERV